MPTDKRKEKTQYCYRCKHELPVDKFYNRESYYCNECRKEYMKNYNREHKEYHKKYYQDHKKKIDKRSNEYNRKMRLRFKIILTELKSNGCAICSSHKHLDFHHSCPTDKKFNISDGNHYSNKVLSCELNKCILLCRKHHKQIEAKERKQ